MVTNNLYGVLSSLLKHGDEELLPKPIPTLLWTPNLAKACIKNSLIGRMCIVVRESGDKRLKMKTNEFVPISIELKDQTQAPRFPPLGLI